MFVVDPKGNACEVPDSPDNSHRGTKTSHAAQTTNDESSRSVLIFFGVLLAIAVFSIVVAKNGGFSSPRNRLDLMKEEVARNEGRFNSLKEFRDREVASMETSLRQRIQTMNELTAKFRALQNEETAEQVFNEYAVAEAEGFGGGTEFILGNVTGSVTGDFIRQASNYDMHRNAELELALAFAASSRKYRRAYMDVRGPHNYRRWRDW